MQSIFLNQKIPSISAPSTGDTVCFNSLDYQGKNIILYFYPRDNTPGCTTEGQNFRDHFLTFQSLNTVIFGISRDSLKVHENFKAKHQFPFELLSDKDESLCQLFDVIKLKTLYGKQVRGIERSTFLIDTQGVLIQEWRKVKVKDHISDILKTLSELPQ